MMIYKKLNYSMNKLMYNKASHFHKPELQKEKQIYILYLKSILK